MAAVGRRALYYQSKCENRDSVNMGGINVDASNVVGKQFVLLKRMKYTCPEGGGSALCEHGKRKQHGCLECAQAGVPGCCGAFCEHCKLKKFCKVCDELGLCNTPLRDPPIASNRKCRGETVYVALSICI